MNYTGLFTPIIYQTPALFNISSGVQNLSQSVNEDTNTRVKLPREALLKFTSEEYDDYIKRISLKRPLTETEHKVSRNQRRKIKNREYAQISRTNRKNQHTQLSTQIEHLNQQNTELIDRVNQLEAENKRLQEENQKLMNFYGSSSLDSSLENYNPPSPPLSQSPPANTSSEESVDIFSEDLTDNYSDWSAFSSKVPFTLFTVFCCLLLFYPFNGLSSSTSPMTIQSDISESKITIGLLLNDRLARFNSYHRKLLNDKQKLVIHCEDFSQLIQNNNTDTRTRPKSLLTIEDVLTEELNSTPLNKNHSLQ